MEIDFLTVMGWVWDRKLGVKIRVPLMISITTMELVQTWLVKIIANILIRQKALQYSLTIWQIKVCQIQTMDKSSLMESSSNCKMFQHVIVNKIQFSTWRLHRISDYLEKIEVPAKSQRRQYRDAEHSQNINNLLTRISKKLMCRMSKIMNQSSLVMQKKLIPSHVLALKSIFVAKLYQKTLQPIHNSSKILLRLKVLIDHH